MRHSTNFEGRHAWTGRAFFLLGNDPGVSQRKFVHGTKVVLLGAEA